MPERSSLSPVVIVSRPQQKRRSARRGLPSHNCKVTSAMKRRCCKPVRRRAASRNRASEEVFEFSTTELNSRTTVMGVIPSYDYLHNAPIFGYSGIAQLVGKLFPAARLSAARHNVTTSYRIIGMPPNSRLYAK